MSWEASGWVLRYSPYTGAGLLVHIVLGDIANEAHEFEIWASPARIAERARVNSGTVRKHLVQMIEDGFLELVEDNSSRNRRSVYRFLMPPVAPQTRPDEEPVAPQTRPGRAGGAAVAPETRPVAPETRPIEQEGNAKPNENQNANASLFDSTPEPVDRFPEFWERYPRRDGKRVGRREAERVWERMSEPDRTAALVGVEHYAASGWRPKDAHRWLRDRLWEDWQTPARPTTNTAPSRRAPIDTNRDAPEGRIDL